MIPVYYPDHDKRYAHIHSSERWKYPDELDRGYLPPIKRTKLLKDITGDDIRKHGGNASLLAKDVPFTKGCLH